MLGIRAQHHNFTFTLDDFTLLTHWFNRRSYLHCRFLLTIIIASKLAHAVTLYQNNRTIQENNENPGRTVVDFYCFSSLYLVVSHKSS